MTQPNRGEVWLVDLGLAAKVRLCLVLSIPYGEEDRSLVTAIVHKTSPRLSPGSNGVGERGRAMVIRERRERGRERGHANGVGPW